MAHKINVSYRSNQSGQPLQKTPRRDSSLGEGPSLISFQSKYHLGTF